jgi:hypothetical protein
MQRPGVYAPGLFFVRTTNPALARLHGRQGEGGAKVSRSPEQPEPSSGSNSPRNACHS